MTLVPGTRLRSASDGTEVVVTRPPTVDVRLTCGGATMIEPVPGQAPPGPSTAEGAGPGPAGTVLGKRYHHPASGLEVLCVRGGPHPMEIGGQPLELRAAKPLPSSD